MHEGVSAEETPVWDPNSGVPPPMTAEYGYVEPALTPPPLPEWAQVPAQPFDYSQVPPLPTTEMPLSVPGNTPFIEGETQTQEQAGPIAETLRSLRSSIKDAEDAHEEETDEGKSKMEEDKVRDIIAAKALIAGLSGREKGSALSKDEREQILSPEVLASLSTEEYIGLWKHLSPHYASHVTRQGYRENSFTYHSAGLGEFHDGFEGMLANGKSLKSPNGIESITQGADLRRAISDYLEQIDFSSLEQVDPWNSGGPEAHPNPWKKIKLRLTASMGSAPKVADETAVHLAADRVLDHMYGGETGNQVFAVYPSDMIASQYDFSFNGGHLGQSFSKELPEGEEKWNDIFVWDKGDPMKTELPLDAGIVFLPRQTLVDPKTGSKYASYKSTITDAGERVIESTLPGDPVSSETYWNDYFVAHPELKPKHVVFYDGDPTKAVQEFMGENEIVPKEGDSDDEGGVLGFDENHIEDMKKDPRTKKMEQRALREGALAIMDHFEHHKELNPDDLLTSEDLEEIRSVISGGG